MKSAEVKAFLSCSFSKEDDPINRLVIAICNALDITCMNVSEGYSETPPEKAKELICGSQIVIAVATCRECLGDNRYQMPDAVHDEISMAFALGKPMLIIKEDGVEQRGFLNNYSSHLTFDRKSIRSNELLKSLISSIHQLKVGALESHDLVPEEDPGYYAEDVTVMSELLMINDEYIWQYSASQQVIITDKFEGVIRNGAWAEFPPEASDENIEWECAITSGSKPFKENVSVEIDSPRHLRLAIGVTPKPEPGDTFKLSTSFRSKGMNAISKAQVPEQRYKIFSRLFDCLDGYIAKQRIRRLRMQFRFPSSYGLLVENVKPFVGRYSSGVNYIVESELKRNKIVVDDFGGNIIVSVESESPLIGHMYGIVWDVPESSGEARRADYR